MSKTNIGWTDTVWNVVTGCDRVSPGCANCYAATMAARLKAMGNPRYQNDGAPPHSGPGFGLTLHEDLLPRPSSWRKPRRVFVNSMSDLFHDDVPVEFIDALFAEMDVARRHRYQILTKRARRMQHVLSTANRCLYPSLHSHRANPHKSIWLGVSAENQEWADNRIPHLLKTPAAVRFLSLEPLLGPVDIRQYLRPLPGDVGLNWVIVGGESGGGRRPLDLDWVRRIRDDCRDAGVPFFYKQGSHLHPGRERMLDGCTHDAMPEPRDDLDLPF